LKVKIDGKTYNGENHVIFIAFDEKIIQEIKTCLDVSNILVVIPSNTIKDKKKIKMIEKQIEWFQKEVKEDGKNKL
jgi:hypothetical protein